MGKWKYTNIAISFAKSSEEVEKLMKEYERNKKFGSKNLISGLIVIFIGSLIFSVRGYHSLYDIGEDIGAGNISLAMIMTVLSGFCLLIIALRRFEANKFIPACKTKIEELRKLEKAEQERKELEYQKELERLHFKEIEKIKRARERENALDYNSAIEIWESINKPEEAARVRKLKSEQGAVKVSQKVVHGDEVTKTEVKDSVINRSNVGGSGKSKAEKIKEIRELRDSGDISEKDYEKMEREIIG